MNHRTRMLLPLLGALTLGMAARPQEPAGGEAASAKPGAVLERLVGSWEGTCRTWFRPGELADESPVKGRFEPLLGGRFVRHTYEGEILGKPRAGEDTLVFDPAAARFESAWIDDFHMSYGILFSTGEATEQGFSVRGEYAVGPGQPAWGWRTELALEGDDSLTITAYNVSPDGVEAKAVETVYTRQAP